MGHRRKIRRASLPLEDGEGDIIRRPYELLAVAIIERAIKDARYQPPEEMPEDPERAAEVRYRTATREEARDWLLSPPCRFFCHSLGIDFAIIETLAYAGFPDEREAAAMAADFNFSGAVA